MTEREEEMEKIKAVQYRERQLHLMELAQKLVGVSTDALAKAERDEMTKARMNYVGENATPVPTLGDPWAHRSQGMRCTTCMWFVRKQPNTKIGRCRRHAPTMNGYPVVFETDWCGDHKLSEVPV